MPLYLQCSNMYMAPLHMKTAHSAATQSEVTEKVTVNELE